MQCYDRHVEIERFISEAGFASRDPRRRRPDGCRDSAPEHGSESVPLVSLSEGIEMDSALLIARLFLALVFGVAGIAKAADPAGTKRAIAGFGVPPKVASLLGYCLPAAEILIATALIPLNTAWLGATAALALLLVFAVGIAANLARGHKPDCHCFGQLHSKPVGGSTLARNLVLMAIAGLIVVRGKGDPGWSALNWLVDLRPAEVLSSIIGIAAVALLAMAVIYLRRLISQHSTLVEQVEAVKKMVEEYAVPVVERDDAGVPPEGLPVGAPAPDFSLPSSAGGQVTLENLLANDKSVLLLFVSPSCSPCKTVLTTVKHLEQDHGSQLTMAVLSKGGAEETRKATAEFGMRFLLLQAESNVAQEYQAEWTPAAVLINREGRIASPVTYGAEAIGTLVAQAAGTDETRSRSNGNSNGNGYRPPIKVGNSLLQVGDPAPHFSLPDLQGNFVKTEDLSGRNTLLVFWNPNCPWCQQMETDLRDLEQNPPKGAPRLVFVSTGEREMAMADSLLFRSQFLHDREGETAPLFGSGSTPSGVLLDSDGRIASGLAGGRRNILMLAGVRKVESPIASGSLTEESSDADSRSAEA